MATDRASAHDALLVRASDVVAQRFGLDFPPARHADLQRGLAGAAGELGLANASACAQRLVAGALSEAQLDVVADHLTVGETYFLRGDETFAAMEKHVLPALIEARRGVRRLRLWSAGCCTGEEAYSLAILVRRLLPDIDDWNVSILATDVNPRFLRRAQEGIYGDWSFRGTDAEFRRRHFSRVAPGRRYAIEPRIRRMVTFAPLNLVEGGYPALATGTNAMDVIFCRNVLMYFTPPQARAAVANLRDCLAPDGWLAVAPCEVSQGLFGGFRTHVLEGAILHQRPVPAAADDAPPADAPSPDVVRAFAPPPPAPVRARSGAARQGAAAVRVAPRPAPAPDVANVGVLAGHARAAASQGRLADALAWCDRWIACDKVDVDAHYLRAMVLLEQGAHDEARAALLRCAFLEPEAVMVSFALGNLEHGLGRRQAAAMHYRNTLRLLGEPGHAGALPHAEGITAPQLAALVHDRLVAGGAA